MLTKDDLRIELNRAMQRRDEKEQAAKQTIWQAESEVKELVKSVEHWVSGIDQVQPKVSHVNVTMQLATGPEPVQLEAIEILILGNRVSITPENNFSLSSPTYVIEGFPSPVRLSGRSQQGWKIVDIESGLPFEDLFGEQFLLNQLLQIAQRD